MNAPTLDISEARKRLGSISKQLEEHSVIYVTRHNKRAFAVVNLDYLSTVQSGEDGIRQIAENLLRLLAKPKNRLDSIST